MASKSYDEGNAWSAVAQYLVAAEQGSVTAAANAAWILRYSELPRRQGSFSDYDSGSKHLDLAARLYERAARGLGGCPSCAIELGNMIHDAEVLGLSRPRNLTEVLRWYRVAADANNSEGLYLLGWVHQRGVGTGRNATAAAELYRRSVRAAGKSRPHQVGSVQEVESWSSP